MFLILSIFVYKLIILDEGIVWEGHLYVGQNLVRRPLFMRQYSKAEKLKIITAYNSGVQATKLSKEYKVSRKIIYIWLNKWKQQGEKILASRKEKRFEHQNLILESQVDIVSKDLKKKPKESVANYEKRVQKELDLLRATVKSNFVCKFFFIRLFPGTQNKFSLLFNILSWFKIFHF